MRGELPLFAQRSSQRREFRLPFRQAQPNHLRPRQAVESAQGRKFQVEGLYGGGRFFEGALDRGKIFFRSLAVKSAA